MESEYNIHMVMPRFYSLALVSPSPVPGSWCCASQQSHPVGVRPPQGCRAGPEIEQHGEGGPSGPVWKEPLLSCSPGSTGGGWGGSALGRPPGLSPAGAAERGRTWPGRGCVRLTASLGDASLDLCLSSGWETAFSLCSALWVLRSKTLCFCATRHGLIPFFCQKIGKGDLDKGAAAVGCHQPSGFSV